MIGDLSELGFVNVAVVSPELRVADVAFNASRIVDAIERAAEDAVNLVVFPELSLTGYTCGDLFHQSLLLDDAHAALADVAAATAETGTTVVVGLPWRAGGRLFNVAAVVAGGCVLGFVPKTHLPTTNEYYEERWFASGEVARHESVTWYDSDVPFGTDLLFDASDQPGFALAIEICEDLWSPQPPSGAAALAGATVFANPSASVESLAKSSYRRSLVMQQSARCLSAYAYAGAGPGESTTDVVFAGHGLIAENGHLLAETERFHFDTRTAVATIDLDRLQHERLTSSSFSRASAADAFRVVEFELYDASDEVDEFPDEEDAPPIPLRRPNPREPFVPSDPEKNAANCREIFAIQSTGLAKRLRHTGIERSVIGVSGGLDSTLALLVVLHAHDIVGLPHGNVVGITMPGFGTSEQTRNNATRLCELLGVSLRTIPIGDAVRQHFADIGHEENQHDVVFENAQARERTQVLMDVANQVGGLVVGTGDLSELALGWCTFNADHMSMYHVNAGVPKTLVRHLVRWCADAVFEGETSRVLHEICDTPITPELLPLAEDDSVAQKTEEAIGPYVLHDFFLFQVVRHGCSPRKTFFLARDAFGDEYPPDVLLKWLGVFFRRFFGQQFKRSAMPDGPKVGTVALSPRGDWRMPSDASAASWLGELDVLRDELPGRQSGDDDQSPDTDG